MEKTTKQKALHINAHQFVTVAHTCSSISPSTQEGEAGDGKFKTTLANTAISSINTPLKRDMYYLNTHDVFVPMIIIILTQYFPQIYKMAISLMYHSFSVI